MRSNVIEEEIMNIKTVKRKDGTVGYVDENGNPLIRRVRRDGSCVFFDKDNNRVAEMPAGTVDVSKLGHTQNQQPPTNQNRTQIQNQAVSQQNIAMQNNSQQDSSDDDDFASDFSSSEAPTQQSSEADNKSWEQRLREQSANDKEYKKQLKEEDKKRFERTKREFREFDSKKKKAKGNSGVKVNKKVIYIALGVVAVLALLVGIKKIVGGKKVTPYSVANSILSGEKGTFTFQFDVATAAIGETVTTLGDSAAEAQLSDAEKMYAEQNEDTAEGAALEETTVVEDSTDAPNSSSEWDLLSQKADWKYPKYTVVISGTTMSDEPLETHFVVNIKTAYTDAKFSEVFVKDGKTYIDIGSMKNWLLGSNDVYLTSLASKLPDGISYLQMNENNMQFYSRYAEDGERPNSGYVSFRQIYLEKGTEIKGIFSAIENAVGKKGLTSDETKASVILQGEDAQSAMTALKNYDSNYLKNYGTIYNGLHDKGIIGDTMLSQAINEQDNRLVAHQGVQTFFLNNKMADMAPNISLSGSKGDVGGIAVLDAALDMQFNADNKTYDVGIKLKRTGETADIVVPQEGVTPLETIGNLDGVTEILYSVIDYFNIFPLKGAVQLELSPNNILDDMLDKFANMVNDLGTYPIHLTKDNIGDYLNEFKGKKPSMAKDEQEANNIKIVSSIMDTLNQYGFGGATGSVSGNESPEYLNNAEQYPTTRANINGAECAIKVNVNESNGRLLVLDAAFTNGSSEPVAETAETEEQSEDTEEAVPTGTRLVSFDTEYSQVGDIESAAEAQAYIIEVNNGLLSTDNEEDIAFIDKLISCARNKDGSSTYTSLYVDNKPDIVKGNNALSDIKKDLENIQDGLETAQEDLENADENVADIVETAHNSIHIDMSAFSIKSLLGSIYPINNDIKIQEYDNTFDISTLVKEIDVEPNDTVYVKMYCILGEDDGHMDIYYNNTQIGVAVEY